MKMGGGQKSGHMGHAESIRISLGSKVFATRATPYLFGITHQG